MKKHLPALFFAIFTAIAVQAQPPVPGPPARPLPADQRPPAPPPPAPALEPVKEYTGKVVRLIANDEYVYDGFYLLSGSDSLPVHFAPLLGSQVTTVLKTGATATVSGTAHPRPLGGQEIRMMSATSNGRTIRDTAAALPPAPVNENFTSGNGKITALQSDPEGHLKGLVVDSKTILRFAPGTAAQLATLAQNGAPITFTGMLKPALTGEATAGNYAVVRCKTVTLNGQQYLIQ